MVRALRSFLASLEDRLYRLFVADSKRAYRIALVVLALVVAAACALSVMGGTAPQRDNANDAVFMLDYAWRFQCGQRQHVDYYDFLGPTSVMPLLLGMAAGGCNSKAFANGAAIVSPILALLGWWVVRRRFPAFAAVCVAAMIAGFPIGVFAPGCSSWSDTAYQEVYNRFEWSLLCLLVLISCFVPKRPVRGAASVLEGLLAGLTTGMLMLGKLNYAVAGIMVLALGLVLNRRSILSWVATILGVGICIGVYLVYLHGNGGAWLRDISMLAGVQESARRLRVMFNIAQTPSTTLDLAIVGLIAALHLRRFLASDEPWPDTIRYLKVLFAVLVLAGVGILTTSGNMQFFAIPLIALGGLLIAETTRSPANESATTPEAETVDRSESYRLRVTLSYLLAAILVIRIAFPDFLSVGYAYFWKRIRGPEMPVDAFIAAPPMQDMLLPPPTYIPAAIDDIRAKLPTTEEIRTHTYQYGRRLNDGLSLLKGRVDKDSRILAFEASNPFPFAFQLPSPRGTPCLWHFGRLQSEKLHPPAEVVFQEVTHLMVPKISEGQELGILHRLFDPYVKEHFEVVAESPMWTLMLRKKNP
jgi:uncharacterized protein (TIGR03382 family)